MPWTRFRLAVCLMNRLLWLLFGRALTDIATCYKAMPTSLYRQLDLQAERFELCAEITAKLFRLGERIMEVPIRYEPRTWAEGKKIGWRDAGQYVWTLLRWRFASTAGQGSDRRRATIADAVGAEWFRPLRPSWQTAAPGIPTRLPRTGTARLLARLSGLARSHFAGLIRSFRQRPRLANRLMPAYNNNTGDRIVAPRIPLLLLATVLTPLY